MKICSALVCFVRPSIHNLIFYYSALLPALLSIFLESLLASIVDGRRLAVGGGDHAVLHMILQEIY